MHMQIDQEHKYGQCFNNIEDVQGVVVNRDQPQYQTLDLQYRLEIQYQIRSFSTKLEVTIPDLISQYRAWGHSTGLVVPDLRSHTILRVTVSDLG